MIVEKPSSKKTTRQSILAFQKGIAEHEKQRLDSLYDEINKSQIKEKPSKEQIKKEKQQILSDNLRFCLQHPTFLLKDLHKDPVCRLCLGKGNVMKCKGKCCEYFHMECLSKCFSGINYIAILKGKMTENVEASNETSVIVENSNGLQCTICKTSTSDTCFVCSKSDDECVQCCGKTIKLIDMLFKKLK